MAELNDLEQTTASSKDSLDSAERTGPADSRTLLYARWSDGLSPLASGRWPLLAATGILATACSILAMCAPGGYWYLIQISAVLWLVVGVGWWIRVILAAREHQCRGRPYVEFRWLLLRKLFVPALFGLMLLLLYSGIPLRLTFWMSESAMDRAAQQIMNTPAKSVVVPKWIGTFPVEKVELFPGGMRFVVRGTRFINGGGFAYIPHGQPLSPEAYNNNQYQRYSDNWYTYHEYNPYP